MPGAGTLDSTAPIILGMTDTSDWRAINDRLVATLKPFAEPLDAAAQVADSRRALQPLGNRAVHGFGHGLAHQIRQLPGATVRPFVLDVEAQCILRKV